MMTLRLPQLNARPSIAGLAAPVVALFGAALLAGCSSKGEIVVDEGVGITAVRTTCPAVGIPDYTGNITLFDQPGAIQAQDIDLAANMTDVRATCDQASVKAQQYARKHPNAGGQVHDSVAFLVRASRADTHGARDVTLPYFVTVLRGDSSVISKRIGTVNLHFADGADRAEARGQGTVAIDKTAATLDTSARDRIMKRRKAGEADAAVDPLDDPEVKAAVNRATFEVLVGFQLNDQQLAYNATR